MRLRRGQIVINAIWTVIFLSLAFWFGKGQTVPWQTASVLLYGLGGLSIYLLIKGPDDYRCPECGAKGKHVRNRDGEAFRKHLNKKLMSGVRIGGGDRYVCNSCRHEFNETDALSYAEIADEHGESAAINKYQTRLKRMRF